MKKFPVWSVVGSVASIVVGFFILYIGVRPFSVMRIAAVSEQTYVYGGMAGMGTMILATGASKLGGVIGNAICDSIAAVFARRRKRKERAEMFTNAVEIPVFRPVQTSQFDTLLAPTEKLIPEAPTEGFGLKPSV